MWAVPLFLWFLTLLDFASRWPGPSCRCPLPLSLPQDLCPQANSVAIPNGGVFLYMETAAFAIWNATRIAVFHLWSELKYLKLIVIWYYMFYCIACPIPLLKTKTKKKYSTLGFPAKMIAQKSSKWDSI